MVFVRGKALIRHVQTREVYEINADMLDFDTVADEERGMGPETAYSAVLHHPQLGQLTWSIWEYPVGAENYRETDVGAHELLENVDFGLQHELPEPDEASAEGENDDDDERQSRIDALVEWFFERYEDPANRLPYVTAEGGYQWIYGGPFDAREQLADNFPEQPEDVVEAAVDEIEADGLTEWAPVASPGDYDQYDEEPAHDFDPNEVARELEILAANLPEPVSAPVFEVSADGLIHMAIPPDAATPEAKDTLLEELREAAKDLCDSLAGTNAHTDMQSAAQRYCDAINGETISISQAYARGVRLANAGEATSVAIARDDLPTLPQATDAHLASVLDLNRAYIMANPVGRELAEGAAAFQRSSSEIDTMRDAARDFAGAVEAASNLFGDDVRQHVAQVAEDVGRGPQPERSNQTAASTFRNLTTYLLKKVGTAALFVGGVVGGAALTSSIPGGALASGGAEIINLCWNFLIANASTLQAVAAAFGTDLSWMSSASQLAKKLRVTQTDS